MAHTPGPWGYDKETDSIRVKEWNRCPLMGDYRGCIVASFEKSHEHRKHAMEEAEANARLIAAAPELLEACKDAKTAIHDWQLGNAIAKESESYVRSVLEKLRTAIAAAEGKEEKKETT